MKVIIIGGFIFDETPLLPLINKFSDCVFIDINNDGLLGIQRKVISKIKYDEEALLIGYSTGGLILLSIYQKIKHLPIRLVMLNSTPCFMEEQSWNGIFLKDYQRLLIKLEELSLELFSEYFAVLAAYPLRRISSSRTTKLLDKHYLFVWLNFLKNADFRNTIFNVELPLLLINSKDDILAKVNLLVDNPQIKMYTLSNSTHSILNYDELFEVLDIC